MGSAMTVHHQTSTKRDTKDVPSPGHSPDVQQVEVDPFPLLLQQSIVAPRLTLKPENIILLQRTIGNRAVDHLLQSMRSRDAPAPAVSSEPEGEAVQREFKLDPGLDRKIEFPERRKVQHEYKHAGDFGVTGNQNNAKLEEFKQKLKEHVESLDSRQIRGTYRGAIDVIHYVNSTANLWVCTEPDGKLVASWKLSATQYTGLITTGNVQ